MQQPVLLPVLLLMFPKNLGLWTLELQNHPPPLHPQSLYHVYGKHQGNSFQAMQTSLCWKQTLLIDDQKWISKTHFKSKDGRPELIFSFKFRVRLPPGVNSLADPGVHTN